MNRRRFNQILASAGSALTVSSVVRSWAAGPELPSLRTAIERELEAKPYPIPGAVVLAGTPEKILLHEAFGFAQITPEKVPMQRDSIFDVASVTKVVATATACAICVDRGLLDPDAPMTKYLPDHHGKGVDRISLRRLATHTSGFPESPRVDVAGAGDAMFKAMLTDSPTWQVDTHYQYACRNIIFLSTIVERVTGRTFGEFCAKEIFEPMRMKDAAFNRVPASSRVVATHYPELGISHNEDTRAADCAIGNAGLFITASDLANFCQMMLRGGVFDGKRILSREVIADFTRSNQLPHFRQHGFIWQRDEREFHRPGRMSSHAYGHAGYTGQSMWIDPDNKRFVLVLSNRTHPKDHGSKSKEAQYRMLARIGDRALEAAAS